MAAPGLFDLELQEEDAIECDQSDDDAIEVEESQYEQGPDINAILHLLPAVVTRRCAAPQLQESNDTIVYTSTMDARHSKSIVWQFFEASKDNAKFACKLCNDTFLMGKKEKTNKTHLVEHLKCKHKKEFDKERKMVKKESEHYKQDRKPGNVIPKTTLKEDAGKIAVVSSDTSSSSKNQKMWKMKSSQAQEIHYAIGEMIAVDGQPFSIVDDVGFSRLMKKVKPNYELPSRKYFSHNIVPSIYLSVMEKVKKIVTDAENISFTTDIWSSNPDTSFISLTGHCVNTNFEQSNVVLKVLSFPRPYTEAYITMMILDILQEFHIPAYKIHLFARDDSVVSVNGVDGTGYDSLSCFLHTLQLVINDCIFEQSMIKDIISNCKKIDGYLNHSALACNKLTKVQKHHDRPQHKINEFTSTRWISTYLMLERIFEQKTAIVNYCLETTGLPVFDAKNWNVIGKLYSLLKIFHKTTVRLTESSCTASNIIPQIKFLKFFITKASTDARLSVLSNTLGALKMSMNERFSKYLEDHNLIIATYLDPRYKDSLFQSKTDETSQMHLLNLEKMMEESFEKRKRGIAEKEREDANSSGNNSDIVNLASEADMDALSDFDFNKFCDQLVAEVNRIDETDDSISSLLKSTPTSSRSTTSFRKRSDIGTEMARYLSMEMQSLEGNPLEWWRSKKNAIPSLSVLANKYLSAPSSSVESERLFSISGNTYGPHRSHLNSTTGEKLMVLSCNLRMFNFEYSGGKRQKNSSRRLSQELH